MEVEKGVKRIKSKGNDRFDCVPLNRPWLFINIGWGGLAPVVVETYTNPASKYNSQLRFGCEHRSDRSGAWLVLARTITPSS
jgi:hypothetical protein